MIVFTAIVCIQATCSKAKTVVTAEQKCWYIPKQEVTDIIVYPKELKPFKNWEPKMGFL
jgi:hypothetical protein